MRLPLLIATVALVAAACSSGPSSTGTSSPPPTSPPSSEPEAAAPPGEFNNQDVPATLAGPLANWETDFSRATVDLDELLVGIAASDPRDLIRPIDNPVYEPVRETTWIADNEPGVLLDIDDDARFFPLSVLTRHEIVNDTVGEVPVAVTYCPLCNTAVTFDRRLGDLTLRLGVSGLLRNSDLVMWDRQTESLWQQITGEAIVGELAGSQLTVIPAGIVRWSDFRSNHPDGRALSEDQGFGIRYGANPYAFYSSRDQPFGFFQGGVDDRLPALERVVGVTVGETEKAYPFSSLTDVRVVNDEIAGEPVVVFWGAADTADALDSGDIANARGIGTGVAYDPTVENQTLTFEAVDDETFRDVETGSTWNILGRAVAGELIDTELELVTHRNEFWFAWQAFFPDGDLWEPAS